MCSSILYTLTSKVPTGSCATVCTVIVLWNSRMTNMASAVTVSYLLTFAFGLAISFTSLVNSASGYYTSARVESCSGCSLNRLPDVKQFIFEDLPQYNNVEFKHIQGAIPELVLFNEHEEEVERLVLSRLTREECNELLVSKGFTKKSKDNKDEM